MSAFGIVGGVLVWGWEGAATVHVALSWKARGWIGAFRTRWVHVGMIRTS